MQRQGYRRGLTDTGHFLRREWADARPQPPPVDGSNLIAERTRRAALRDNSNLRAILFRKETPELERSLIRESHQWYSQMGATYHATDHLWAFPSGATVEFAHLEKEDDIFKIQGCGWSYLGFGKSMHFLEAAVRYLRSRTRATDSSLRIRTRLTTNPGNVGHKWHCKWKVARPVHTLQ